MASSTRTGQAEKRGLFGLGKLLHRQTNHVRLHWLTSDLVLSREPADEDFAFIHESGVRTVIDLRAETDDRTALAEAAGLGYVRLPVDEGRAPSQQELRMLTGLIIDKVHLGPVLVHCREGRGRSAMVATAALVRFGYPLLYAYSVLQNSRPDASFTREQEEALTLFAENQRSEEAHSQDETESPPAAAS